MCVFPPTLLASHDLFVKCPPGNVLPIEETFVFLLKTELQSNNGQFLDLLCLTIPVFTGQSPLRFCDRGNHRAPSIPICFFQFPSFSPNLHHFLCPLIFRSFHSCLLHASSPKPVISSPQLPVSFFFFFAPVSSPFLFRRSRFPRSLVIPHSQPLSPHLMKEVVLRKNRRPSTSPARTRGVIA